MRRLTVTSLLFAPLATFAADFDQIRRVLSAHPKRDLLHRLDISGHVLTNHSVSTGCGTFEYSLPVSKRHSYAVDL